uniref:RNA dependent RNA polymerase n=1 Tax=Insect virga-like virus 1 TaxID=2819105 RepID=A0A8F5XUM9_9VIRU|nr:RNA dependent RNA polymerase [Insect virga-like virus 1]
MITKLGRHDLVNHDHVEEYRISLCDLMRPFSNAYVNTALSAAMAERYSKPFRNFSLVFATMYNLVHDPIAFHDLYYFEPDDNVCEDPSRPNLDFYDTIKLRNIRIMNVLTGEKRAQRRPTVLVYSARLKDTFCHYAEHCDVVFSGVLASLGTTDYTIALIPSRQSFDDYRYNYDDMFKAVSLVPVMNKVTLYSDKCPQDHYYIRKIIGDLN